MGKTFQTAPGPVSAAFDLSPLSTESMRERVRRALSIVDGVHLVGSLPRIPIDHVVDPHARAQYRSQVNRGRALGIGIDPFEPRVEMAIVHEIGHFLDHQALGSRGGFASRRHQNLDMWRRAVTTTRAFRRLTTIERGSNETLATILDRAVHPDDRDFITRLLLYTEVWARSYVHYIATVSSDSDLRYQLAEEEALSDPIQALGFWDDSDFMPVHHAIDDVFRQKGWVDETGNRDR